jgi:carbon storage regulator
MLVLTRRPHEAIIIGDHIEVKVLSVDGEKVRIGIQAPREIPVYRLEIYLEIAQQNAAAGGSARAEVDAALKRLGTTADASSSSAQRVPPWPAPGPKRDRR